MSWLQRLWRRKRLEEQLDKELRFHLEQQASDLAARGVPPAEARRLAALALGGTEQVKEACRDARGTRWLEDFLQDLNHAVRTLRQRPGFAAVALLTLALGTGVTTVMVTVVSGVLLKPLSFPEPDRLVIVHEQTEKYQDWAFSYPDFLDCRRESQALAPMAAWRWASGTVSAPGEAEYVPGRQISAGLFSTFGVALVSGREFRPDEDRPGGVPVAILGYRLWQERFGGRASAIGAQLVFDGRIRTVVGVAPRLGFGLGADDVFTPLGQNTEPTMQSRDMHPGIQVVARLRPGGTLAQARAELALIGDQLSKQYPKTNAGRTLAVRPYLQDVVGDVRPTLWLLLGAAGVVLMVACVNVASLLLARAVGGERERAMRAALGAGRGRLVRQCLTESGLLAAGGGALGVLIAAAGTHPFLALWPGELPRAADVHIDWRVLVFALAASLVSGLLFGLAPALRAPGHALERALRAGARTVRGSSLRLHGAFVISEVGLACVLLVAAAGLGRALLHISSLYPGVNPHNVLVTQVALSPAAMTSPARTRGAWQQVMDNVRGISGVQSAALADSVPMSGDDDEIGYWLSPAAPRADRIPMALLNLVTPDYLRAMGIRLLQGRFFTDQDRIGKEPVAVVDEIMARRAFGSRDAVGRRIWLQVLGPVRVIGVTGHVRYWGLDADDTAKVREQIYVPFALLPDPFMVLASGMSLVVRTTVAPMNLVEAIRRQVRGTARDQAIYKTRTMEQIVSGTLARQRFLLSLFGIFAGLALLLACIGIYGVLAYLTNQRVPEFGVRLALGASAGEVLRLVLRHSLKLVLVGLGLGVAASFGVERLLGSAVPDLRAADGWTLAVPMAFLAAAALAASFLPAWRASRTDPTSTLRQE